jgi:HAD superfamily hydrolase (TIGR01509 family)
VHSPPLTWWVERAWAAVGRDPQSESVRRLVSALTALESTPAFLEDELRVDTSSETNRSVMMGRFRSAGFDDELAEAMYRVDLEADAHPVYPDVPECLEAIHDRGCLIALVSDFHYDLRPELETQGIAGWFDAFVISYEHGFQKPDPRMFATALTQLDAQPREALMVGDRASHDGGAAAVGIDTLILPAPREFGPRGLDVILRLL